MADPVARATVDRLLASAQVTAATRAVLTARLQAVATSPTFLDHEEFALLTGVIATLLPGDSAVDAAAVACAIDGRLAAGVGDGWRYDSLPGDASAYRTGLRLIADSSFAEVPRERRGAALAALLAGDDAFDFRRWFEDLLVATTEAHVAHPVTQVAMGCTAFADVLSDGDAPERRALDDGAMRRHAERDVVDAVVIGTGAGGGPLLWRLARAGLSVVALEAGKRWNPSVDFPTDEVAQAPLFWRDERLSAGGDPLAFGNNNSGIGVGGSTLHFTAYMPRPQPDDFRLATDFGVGVDWPFAYEELVPWLDEVETIVGVSGPATYPWGPTRRAPYPLPSLPLNVAATLMQRGCAALGIATSPAPNAAISRRYASLGQPSRQACTHRGFCQAGCSTGAKGSVDVVFVPPAIGHGAELRTGAFATRIERDAHGRVSGVVYRQDGVEKRQRCRHVFLCGGAIETPRLLLMNDLANGSDQVGRNFMAHTGLQLWAFFDEPTRPWRGIPGGLISEAMHRPPGADFAGGYLLQSIGVMPVTYASQLARSGAYLYGDALAHHLSRYDHVAGINILGECLPHDANRVELSDERDARGLPKPRVTFTAGANEAALTSHAEATMRSIFAAAGARDPWRFQRFAHVIGTCRMGDDARTSVVDADGRSHEVPGLYVCDNSVFPSALSANPALTIMALSLRTADRFLSRNARH